MPPSRQPRVDDQTLRAYLIGQLPLDQVEQFDEWSVTDDEFSARLDTVECDLVDSYVRGELTGDALAKFQTVYLASPKRRQRVAFAESLHARPVQAPAAAAAEEKDARAAWFGLTTFPRFAFAGGLGMMLAIGVLLVDNLRLREHMNQAGSDRAALQQKEQALEGQLESEQAANAKTADELKEVESSLARLESGDATKHAASQLPSLGLNVVAFVLAPQLRGTQMPTVKIPQGTSRVDIRLELENNNYPRYRGTLKSVQSEKVLWQSSSLRATTKNEASVVSMSLPAKLLSQQIYQLDLAGKRAAGGGDLVSSYVFKVLTE